MRVLLTGGYGCIGSWIARNLLDKGSQVYVYDLKEDPRRLRLILPEEKVRSTVASIAKAETKKRQGANSQQQQGHREESSGDKDQAALVDELARLDPIAYDRRREKAAEQSSPVHSNHESTRMDTNLVLPLVFIGVHSWLNLMQ